MIFNYAAGYDRRNSLTIGYLYNRPLDGKEVEDTFEATDEKVLAKAAELIAVICDVHGLGRKPAEKPAEGPVETP